MCVWEALRQPFTQCYRDVEGVKHARSALTVNEASGVTERHEHNTKHYTALHST